MQQPLPDCKTVARSISETAPIIPDISNIIARFAENYRFHNPVETAQHQEFLHHRAQPYPHAPKVLVYRHGKWKILDIHTSNTRDFPVHTDNKMPTASRDHILVSKSYVYSMLDPETLQPVYAVHKEPCSDPSQCAWASFNWTYACFYHGPALFAVDPRCRSEIPVPTRFSLPLVCGDYFYAADAELFMHYGTLRDFFLPKPVFLDSKWDSVSTVRCSDTLVATTDLAHDEWRMAARAASDPRRVLDTVSGDELLNKFVIGDHIYGIFPLPNGRVSIKECM